MKRVILMTFCMCILLMPCALSQAAERPRPAVVGLLGDPVRLEFEGNASFTPEEIRRTLMMTPDFLLASHPAAPLSDYLSVLKRLMQSGYQRCGFPDARVSVDLHENREQIRVKVSEGPRYMRGRIDVMGADTLPTEAFVTQLTQPRIKKTDSGKSEEEDPIWQTGKPAPFGQASLKHLNKQIKSVLSELGFYFCMFSVEVVPEPGTSKARLVIQIKEEGLRAISEIVINGNTKNTREQILQYLDLKEGMPLDRALVLKTEKRLWHSARFLDHTVIPSVETDRKAIKLTIDLREYEHAPGLCETFSPEERLLLKCGDWLSGFRNRADDLMLEISLKEIDMQLQLVISPSQGVLLILRQNHGTQGTDVLNAALLTPKKTTFFSPTGKTMFVLPALSAQVMAELTITPNPDIDDDKLFVIRPGVGVKKDKSGSGDPYELEVNLAPVFFVYCAHQDNVDVTRLSDAGIVSFSGDSKNQIKIDRQSGRLIDMTPFESETGQIALTVKEGLFDRLTQDIEQSTSDHTNRYAPQSPIGSLSRYVAEMPLLHWELYRRQGDSLGISDDELSKAAAVIGKILEKAIAPFDQWLLTRQNAGDDTFRIPASHDETAVPSMRQMVTMVGSLVFGACNELFPPGSWPWTLARETVFVAGGMGKYTQRELGRTYQSSQTGPIGYLATAKLLTLINPPLSRAFAAKGLETLLVDDFQKDWRLLVMGDHLLSQCLSQMVQVLTDLNDDDLNAVLAVSSPDQTRLIRECIDSLRENAAKPMHQTLAPVFERHWQSELKDKVEKALRSLANPMADADISK